MIDTTALEARLDAIEARIHALEASEPAAAMPGMEWFDINHAATYVGLTPNALRKVAGERREIPYEQDGPHCKMWFSRSALDSYRLGKRTR